MIKGKKYYKNLYEIELKNRELLIKQNSELSGDRIKSDIENQKLKKVIASLKFELEDTKGFLKQETEAKEYLLKERKKLRTMITKLGGDWKNAK